MLSKTTNTDEFAWDSPAVLFNGAGVARIRGERPNTIDAMSESLLGSRAMGEAMPSCEQYRALLAVSEAIVAHRDSGALFHELADRLRQVVHFDYLGCTLHDATSNTMRLHVLESTDPISVPVYPPFSVEEDPGGMVLQTQHPLIISNVAEESRWPQFPERAKPFGVNSLCLLPLTTAHCRLGVLAFGSKQAGAYDTADVDFLQQVANQVAVAVENALAFDEIEALKDKLHQEKVYLEEEVRTEHNFGEIVGESAALRRVLKEVETVAPTDSTVLIRGETGTGKELIARALHALEPPTGADLRQAQLRGHPHGAARKASCSATRRAPSPAPSPRRSAASSWPTRGRCSSTRSATSRRSCSPSCSASCRSRSSSAWAARAPSGWTCAWWRPRTMTWARWSPTAASAATSTTA